jgi:hypothetical protein
MRPSSPQHSRHPELHMQQTFEKHDTQSLHSLGCSQTYPCSNAWHEILYLLLFQLQLQCAVLLLEAVGRERMC